MGAPAQVPDPDKLPKKMLLVPQIDAASVRGFAQAWDYNGIKIILDPTTIQFATDFANQCLKSFVFELSQRNAVLKAQREATGQPQPEKPKSSLILTDAS